MTENSINANTGVYKGGPAPPMAGQKIFLSK